MTPLPAHPSLPARCASLSTRLGFRPLTAALPHNTLGVAASRTMMATLMAVVGPPLRGTTVVAVDDGAITGEWVAAPGVEFGDRVIYYLHGSGYVICSPRTHRGLISRLSRATGLPVFVPDYRLAPENRFPAAADDVAAGYRWLLNRGFAAADIVVAGDSAGGHLALDLVVQNGRTGIAQPAALALLSPVLDLTFSLAAQQESIRPDPMISAARARMLVDNYTKDMPADSDRLALAIDSRTSFPPMLIQTGGAEMLSADARTIAELVRGAGGPCELQIWPGQMHVFQAMPLVVPEANQAIERIATFLADSAQLAATAAAVTEKKVG